MSNPSDAMPLTTFYAAFISLFLALKRTVDAFSVTPKSKSSVRGSAPLPSIKSSTVGSTLPEEKARWQAKPSDEKQARLIILQITDVYTLDHFASFKTLLEETRANAKGAKVVCMLTGDFLSPYLLASIDRGAGMMNALNKVPMDYLTWGNHEADVKHKVVCRHVRNFKGKWINSNMLDHEAMESQQEYDVIELESPDGTNNRKVGLCAVLSDDPNLYASFKAPGAFGGAKITDPWEALRKYEKILKEDEKCDLVIPLEHLYVPDDHKTCRDFDFPVILSGHDHHMVDETVEGTRLLKPGQNAVHATVVEVCWENRKSSKPTINAHFVRTSDWKPDPVLQYENECAYDVLKPLRNTELAKVPKEFFPLSSNGSRSSVCSMGRYVCSLIRKSMNWMRRQRGFEVDAVLLMGGNIRGNADYPDGSFFSLEALEAEVKSDEVIGTVPMPGWLLAEGVEATHSGDPIPGWLQYDDGVKEDYSSGKPKVTHVAGEPIDPNQMYRVATKIGNLTNGQSKPWTKYYKANPTLLPPKGAYVNIHAELMSYFARILWWKLWFALEKVIPGKTVTPEDKLEVLDQSGDGTLTVEDIHHGLRDVLRHSLDDRVTILAEFVHAIADENADGKVTLEDLHAFRDEMMEQDSMIPEEMQEILASVPPEAGGHERKDSFTDLSLTPKEMIAQEVAFIQEMSEREEAFKAILAQELVAMPEMAL